MRLNISSSPLLQELLAALQWFLNLDLPLLSSFTSSCTKSISECVLHLFFSLHWVIISTSLAKVLILCFRTEFLLANVFEHSSHFICKKVSSATLKYLNILTCTFPLAWLLILLSLALLLFSSCFTSLPCAVCVNMSWITGCTTSLSCPPRGNSPSLAHSLPQSYTTCFASLLEWFPLKQMVFFKSSLPSH